MDLASVIRIILTAFFTPMGNVFSADPRQQQMGLPMMLVSDPGRGKTSVIRQLLNRMRYTDKEGELQNAALMSFEPGSVGEAGFGVTPVPVEANGVLSLAFPPLVDIVNTFGTTTSNVPGLMFIDEASTARGQQLDALLTCVQYGKIGSHHLGPRVRRIGAMNPSAQTAGGELIGVAVSNRLCWVNFPGPTLDEWISYQASGSPLSVAEEDLIDVDAKEKEMLSKWALSENFPAALASIGGWLKACPDFQNKMPDLNSNAASGPWPSDRSNDYGVRVLAAANIMGLSHEERNTMMFGVLGEAAGHSWYTWHQNADLPDIGMFLDGQQKFQHRVERLDRTNAVLAGCRVMLKDTKCPNRKAKAKRFWSFMGEVAADATDLLAPAVNDMFDARLIGMPEARPVLAQMEDVIGVTKR